MLEENGASNFPQLLSKFESIFVGHENKALATLLKTAENRIDKTKLASAEEHDSVENLCNALTSLKYLLSACKAKVVASDLEKILTFLKPYKKKSVSALSLEIKEGLKKKAANRTRSAKPVDLKKAREIADSLTKANMFSKEFQTIINKIKTDRSLRKVEIDAVANIFLGLDRKYKSKSEAIEKIADRHFQDNLHEARGKVIDKMVY